MAQAIAKVQTDDRNINQLQQNIAQAVGPILKNPLCLGSILTKVTLQPGTNTISHGLGRALQGWSIVRLRSSATVYDQQDSNTSPSTTLVLVSSAPVVADIYVF